MAENSHTHHDEHTGLVVLLAVTRPYLAPFVYKQPPPPTNTDKQGRWQEAQATISTSSLGKVGDIVFQPICHKQCPPTSADVQFHRCQGRPAASTKQAVAPRLIPDTSPAST